MGKALTTDAAPALLEPGVRSCWHEHGTLNAEWYGSLLAAG